MNCKQAHLHYYEYIRDKASLPPETAAHIEDCIDCRQQVEELRRQLQERNAFPDDKALLRGHLKLHAGLTEQWVSCKTVQPFLPALLIDFLRVTTTTPVTAHIEHCPQCREYLGQIQALGLTSGQLVAAAEFLAGNQIAADLPENAIGLLRTIADSEDSQIETRMSVNACDSVLRPEQPAVQVRYGQQSRWGSRRHPFNYVMTTGFAAAAVIVVMMLFPLTAGGNLEKVNRAVNSVSNLHVLRYSQKNELIQEIWMSRTLGFKLSKQPQNVLFKNLRSGIIMQAKPGREPSLEHEGIREQEQYARLLPFEQLKDLPPGYSWNFKGQSVLEDGRNVRVYELIWDTGGPSLVICRKWRGYLDEKSSLPYKIEWLEKISDQEFELSATLLIDYPTEAQCMGQLNAEGFQRFLTEDHAE